MDELIGKTLGQYRIDIKIGQGGMAAVFRAYQPSLERYVALKVLPPSFAAKDPVFMKRFRREAHSIARLNHPNILPIYDFGIEQDYSYIVMRYIEKAHTLSAFIARFPRLEQNLEQIGQVASALTYAHQQGVVHRDVKPSNVLVDGDWALLSDFGVAKLEEVVSTRLTDTGRSLGTAAYMSPEQARGEPTDHRTDIYALGVMVYEILTGLLPHDASSSLAIMLKRTTEPPQPPRELNPNIPVATERVVLRALAGNRNERFNNAVEFFDALKYSVAAGNSSPKNTAPLIRSTTDLNQLVNSVRSGAKINQDASSINPSSENVPLDNKPDLEQPTKSWSHPVWLAVIGSILAVGLLLWLSNGAISSTSLSNDGSFSASTSSAAMASTATAIPTRTPTPRPTKTLLPPTATPTETPLPPTETPLPSTHTPTPTETPAPAPPIAVSTVARTPTPALPNDIPTLLKPLSVDEEPSFGPTIFEWRWEGDLPPELGFEVRVWRDGEPPAGVHDAVLDNQQGKIEKIGQNRYRLEVDISEAAGVRSRTGLYLWTVAVVQISPMYADSGLIAEPAPLRFEAGGGGGNDGGNDGGGSSGGSIS